MGQINSTHSCLTASSRSVFDLPSTTPMPKSSFPQDLTPSRSNTPDLMVSRPDAQNPMPKDTSKFVIVFFDWGFLGCVLGRLFVGSFGCVFGCEYTCACMYMCVCACVCTCVFVCVHVCVCVMVVFVSVPAVTLGHSSRPHTHSLCTLGTRRESAKHNYDSARLKSVCTPHPAVPTRCILLPFT